MLKNKLPIRIYFEDTDAAGIVYYANYLKFAERARTEFLRSENISNSSEFNEKGRGFVVMHCEVDYKVSARLDDLIDVYTKSLEVKKASVIMEQIIKKEEKELVTLKVKLAYIDNDSKLCKIPEKLMEKLG